jgi:hypothetical protein
MMYQPQYSEYYSEPPMQSTSVISQPSSVSSQPPSVGSQPPSVGNLFSIDLKPITTPGGTQPAVSGNSFLSEVVHCADDPDISP